jgi:hypothetical protein
MDSVKEIQKRNARHKEYNNETFRNAFYYIRYSVYFAAKHINGCRRGMGKPL